GIPERAKEIHGFAQILTFSDGPRTCLGRQFAAVEFKVIGHCSLHQETGQSSARTIWSIYRL
ncbi:hypothetical protein M422DRAFT_159309, partial [Sphaerobolus stellatus SS14]